MTFLGLADPTPTELAVAGQIQNNLEQRFGPLVYSRADLIGGHAGVPQVVEVELIDPNLSLSLYPLPADTLAAAPRDHLDRCPPARRY